MHVKKTSERIYDKLNSRLHLRRAVRSRVGGTHSFMVYHLTFVLIKKHLKYTEMHREPYKESELLKDRKSVGGHVFCKSFLFLNIYYVDEAIETFV